MKNLVIILSLTFGMHKELSIFATNYFQDEVVFVAADEAPEFSGGENGLRNYLKNNVWFPEEAMRAKVNGRVVASL